MYMCVLFDSISFELCWGLVVFAGEKSLRSYYNIRHADLHEIVTFSHIKFYEFEQLPCINICGIIINIYEILNTPMSN